MSPIWSVCRLHVEIPAGGWCGVARVLSASAVHGEQQTIPMIPYEPCDVTDEATAGTTSTAVQISHKAHDST